MPEVLCFPSLFPFLCLVLFVDRLTLFSVKPPFTLLNIKKLSVVAEEKRLYCHGGGAAQGQILSRLSGHSMVHILNRSSE